MARGRQQGAKKTVAKRKQAEDALALPEELMAQIEADAAAVPPANALDELSSALKLHTLQRNTEAVVRLTKDMTRVLEHMTPENKEALPAATAAAELLASEDVLKYQDVTARLYVATALAESLRLFAPSWPFEDATALADILELFVDQLDCLGSSSPETERRFHLLEVLRSMQVFALAGEVDKPGFAIEAFVFRALQRFLRIADQVKRSAVDNSLADIVLTFFEEDFAFSDRSLDLLFAAVLPRNERRAPHASELAVSVLRRRGLSLALDIAPYFDGLLGLRAGSESELRDEACDIIRRLCEIDTQLVSRVIPQFEMLLKVEDEASRHNATRLLAHVFAMPGGILAIEHHGAFNAFLNRFSDVSADIRETVAAASGALVCNLPPGPIREDVVSRLQRSMMDVNDTVRTKACVAVVKLLEDNATVVPSAMRDALFQRRLDKSWSVRETVLSFLGRHYAARMSSLETAAQQSGKPASRKDELAATEFARLVVRTFLIDDNVQRAKIESLLQHNVLALDISAEQRAHRLHILALASSDEEWRALEGILKNKAYAGRLFRAYLEACTEKDSVDSAWQKCAEYCGLHVVSKRHIDDLETVISSGAMTALSTLAATQPPDIAEMQEAEDSILECCDSEGLKEAAQQLIARVKPLPIDDTVVRGLLAELRVEEEPKAADAGVRLLKLLTRFMPSCIGKGSQALLVKEVTRLGRSGSSGPLGMAALFIISSLGGQLAHSPPSNLFSALKQLAAEGTSIQAKHATKALCAAFEHSPSRLTEAVEDVVAHLKVDDAQLPTALRSLGYFALLAPSIFESEDISAPNARRSGWAGIIDVAVKQLLLVNQQPQDAEAASEDEEWQPMTPECEAKVMAMKLLVRRLLGKAKHPLLPKEVETLAEPVLRLLSTCLRDYGQIPSEEQGVTPAADQARLRLAAAKSLLKLASSPTYRRLITPEYFVTVAQTMQDSCVQVRSQFAHKLRSLLNGGRLAPHYAACFILSAIDPVKERRVESATMLHANVAKARHLAQRFGGNNRLPEYSMPFVVHLLAYHPDFAREDHAILFTFQQYLEFYFDQLCRGHNDSYPLLKRFVDTIKRTKSVPDASRTTNIWAVCDLAALIIIRRSEQPGVSISLNTVAEVPLPASLYASAGDKAKPSTVFLPPNFKLAPRPKMIKPLLSVPQHDTSSSTADKPTAKRTKSKAAERKKTKATASARKLREENPTRRQARRGAKADVSYMEDEEASSEAASSAHSSPARRRETKAAPPAKARKVAQAALSDSDDSEAESDDAGVLELDVQSDDGSAAEERPESEESEESEASEAEESAASPAKTKLTAKRTASAGRSLTDTTNTSKKSKEGSKAKAAPPPMPTRRARRGAARA